MILSSFGENRKFIKELFLTVLNAGFKDIYSDDKQTNNYLKSFEQEIINIQNYFYINDKRYLQSCRIYIRTIARKISLNFVQQLQKLIL